MFTFYDWIKYNRKFSVKWVLNSSSILFRNITYKYSQHKYNKICKYGLLVQCKVTYKILLLKN